MKQLKVPKSGDIDAIINNYRDRLKRQQAPESIVPKLRTYDCWGNLMATGLQITAVRICERVAFKTAYKFLVKGMSSHIDDVMQEAYLVAMECCDKYVDHAKHDPKTFEKLVARATKYRLIDYMVSIQPVHIPLRSYKRGICKILGFDPEGVKMTTLQGVDKAANYSYTEEESNEVMDRLFEGLSDEDEMIARMRYRGEKIQDIADHLERSVGYIHKRIKKIQGSIL